MPKFKYIITDPIGMLLIEAINFKLLEMNDKIRALSISIELYFSAKSIN
jgi:hypothetical protein